MKPDATIVVHRIEEVSYKRDTLVCKCGEVMRAEGGWDWQEHRSRTGVTAAANAAKRKR